MINHLCSLQSSIAFIFCLLPFAATITSALSGKSVICGHMPLANIFFSSAVKISPVQPISVNINSIIAITLSPFLLSSSSLSTWVMFSLPTAETYLQQHAPHISGSDLCNKITKWEVEINIVILGDKAFVFCLFCPP